MDLGNYNYRQGEREYDSHPPYDHRTSDRGGPPFNRRQPTDYVRGGYAPQMPFPPMQMQYGVPQYGGHYPGGYDRRFPPPRDDR